jgi:hypothetical protein
MPLSLDHINSLSELIAKLKSDQPYRLSNATKLSELSTSELAKYAMMINISIEVNPNTNIYGKDWILIIQNIIENAETIYKPERTNTFSYVAVNKQIEQNLIISQFGDLTVKPYLTNKSLFKYHALNENTFSAIEESYIYHSDVTRFNDPFDCSARLISKFYKKNTYPKYPGDVVNKLLGHIGVACFSKTNRSILMWSHYAKDHTGICIEYNSFELNWNSPKYETTSTNFFYNLLLKYCSSFFNKLYEVDYTSDLIKYAAMPTRNSVNK